VETRYNDWITARIREFDFVEGRDFIYLTENQVSCEKLTEYYLTPNMAKELSMVERNDKGKEVRLYFIRCEQVVNGSKILSLTPLTMNLIPISICCVNSCRHGRIPGLLRQR